jgi:hypothetical protein
MSEQAMIRRFDGHGQCERGLWVECHTEECCVKVLKSEIMNSRKQEPLNSYNQLRFFLGGLKMARLKIEKMILDL